MNEKSLSERIIDTSMISVCVGFTVTVVICCIAGSLLLIKFCLQQFGLWGWV